MPVFLKMTVMPVIPLSMQAHRGTPSAACADPWCQSNGVLGRAEVEVFERDAELLRRLTGYAPQTEARVGVAQFVAWFRDYYEK